MAGIELATAYVSLVGETAKLKKDINKAFEEADKASVRAGKSISSNLGAGFSGASSQAAKAGKDAAAAYEKSLQAQIRGEQIGAKIGTVVGKGIGFGIKAGIGVAAAGATVAVAGLTAALTKGFSRLKNIDAAKFKLLALGNSASDVDAIMKSALASVKGTAFGLDSAANAAATAVAAGIPQGQGLTDYLKNVADAAAIAQTSMDEMGSIFNKVQTNGKAMTDDLQMLADRGLPIFTWLQKQYGVTGAALQKMVEDGKVSSADFQKAIHDNIGGAALKMGQSFQGAIDNANAALGRLGAALLAPAFENASGGIGSLTTALDGMGKWLSQHKAGIIDFWASLAKVAATTAQQTLLSVSDILEAVAGLAAGIGNVVGGVYKLRAWSVIGDDKLKAELNAQAEAAFGWGEGLQEVSDRLHDAADKAGDFYGIIDKWRDTTKAVAAVTDALGDSFQKVNDNGHIEVSSNATEKMAELNDLGLVVQNLPDGKFEVVAGTPEAQTLIDAFVAKNSTLPPAKLPIDVDISAATAKLQALYNDIFRAPPNAVVPSTGGNAGSLILPGGYSDYDPSRLARRPGVGGGRATGGAIRGPGTATSDSIPSWLSNGEHVFTAADVRAMGGQAGVYAFRNALHRKDGGNADAADLLLGQQGMSGPPNDIFLHNLTRRRQIGPPRDVFSGASRGRQAITFGGQATVQAAPGQLGYINPAWRIDTSNASFDTSGYDTMRLTFADVADAGVFSQDEIDSATTGNKANRIRRSESDPLWKWFKYGQGRFADGGAVGAIDAAYNNSGKPYNYGSFDCSYYMSLAYAGMAGLPPGRYFTTETDFEALGFKRGYKPGALNIGVRRGGGGPNSHMAGTLPNGVNIENAGSGSVYGGNAKGANDFPLQWYYEGPLSGDMGALQDQSMQDRASGVTSNAAAPQLGGGQGVDSASGGALGDAGSGRTEGYIPAGAGHTGASGSSLASGLLDLGAEAINGIIDQAASAASTAASAAVAAGSMGGSLAAGPAAGAGTSFLIGLGANAAKRGVSYGFDMAGIGIDALAEIASPFGVPRLFSSDPTAFIPHSAIAPAATTTGEMLSSGIDPNTPQHGLAQGAPPGPQAPPPGPQAPPSAGLTPPTPDDLQAPPPGLTIGAITGMNPDDVADQLLRYQRLNALQYQGRP